MLPYTQGWVSAASTGLLLEKQHKVCDMHGKLNQTQLCMNECRYMGFTKKVLLCAGPTGDKIKHIKEPFGAL